MAIVSGYQKMKDYIKQTSGYQLLSRWANANTLECDDGKTLQDKVGGISGISSSLTANSTTQAASTNLTNQLYQNMNQLSSDLGGCRLVIQDGVPYIQYEDGADTVLKKLGSISQYADITASPTPNSASMTFDLSTIPNHKDLVLWETLFPRMMTHLDMANWNTTMSRAVAFDWSYDASTGALTITSQNPAAVIVQYGTGITDRTVRVYYV